MADEKQLIDIEALSHFKAKLDVENANKFMGKDATSNISGFVRYDTAQILTPEQKAQAKANLGITEGGSGGSAENEIVVIEPETFEEETMTGSISEESVQKINDNGGIKPVYLNCMGAIIPYALEGMFALCVGEVTVVVELDTNTRQFTLMFVEQSGGSGFDVEQDFEHSTLDELSGTVPSRSAVMNYINQKCVALDENGKVPSDKLPSYVDDVVEGYYGAGGISSENRFWSEYEKYENGTESWGNVIVGESGKIYIDLFTGNTYRWSGTQYVRLNPDEYTVATNYDIDALFT